MSYALSALRKMLELSSAMKKIWNECKLNYFKPFEPYGFLLLHYEVPTRVKCYDFLPNQQEMERLGWNSQSAENPLHTS
jgi:hypothetical protein